ncbi:MAG: hypothetical protein ACTHMF_01105 [Leifsonia sp.]|uniref:hypothetical protein n=1 Tax=Leifsonia sp. TaxID=1870902 RepID=UPI003F7FB62B
MVIPALDQTPAIDRPDPGSPALESYLAVAAEADGHVAPLLDALAGLAPADLLPLPGSGATLDRFRGLARVAAADVTAARVLEPHLDAVAILAEAGEPAPPAGSTWGVFAAEAPGAETRAVRTGAGWALDGRKAWCSLAGSLTHALVSAVTDDDGGRRLFAVALRDERVRVEPAGWVAHGLAEVESGPVRFDAAPATPVGATGWYLDRPGFRWGGIGVAACWLGATLPLLGAVTGKARSRQDDALTGARAGALHRSVHAARLALADAAARIDGGAEREPAALAHTVRGLAADAAVEALACARDVLGPAALAFDASLARRCADLELYVAQYHRGRDDASLARHLGEEDASW